MTTPTYGRQGLLRSRPSGFHAARRVRGGHEANAGYGRAMAPGHRAEGPCLESHRAGSRTAPADLRVDRRESASAADPEHLSRNSDVGAPCIASAEEADARLAGRTRLATAESAIDSSRLAAIDARADDSLCAAQPPYPVGSLGGLFSRPRLDRRLRCRIFGRRSIRSAVWPRDNRRVEQLSINARFAASGRAAAHVRPPHLDLVARR